MEANRELLRHMLATIAYRGGKAVRGAPDTFAGFQAGGATRTPGRILAHMGDLFDWALTLARGEKAWCDATPLPWNQEAERFFQALTALDAYLASGQPLACSMETLLQGPIADALTHIGQINILRRVAGCPVRGENYSEAEIHAGRVGADQPPPRREFD